MTMKSYSHIVTLVFGMLLMQPVLADMETELQRVQHRWAEVNYHLQGKTQVTSFERLADQAESLTERYPRDARTWIWSGIVKSSYAGAKGGLGALKIAKMAKSDFEKALSLDPTALQGSAYTSLGTLYFNVPGWPLGFGDDEKAEELLRKALSLNPDGIDSNYFYASYLISQDRFKEARQYLNRARQAPPREGRALADAGRQEEILSALEEIDEP